MDRGPVCGADSREPKEHVLEKSLHGFHVAFTKALCTLVIEYIYIMQDHTMQQMR